MDVRLTDDVRRLVAWHHRLGVFVQLSYYAVWVAAAWYAFWTVGAGVGLAVFGGVYLVGSLPAFEVEAESVLVTDDPPDVVREAFRRVDSPVTAVVVGWADELHEPPAEDADDVVAVARQSFLGAFTRKFSLAVRELDDGTLRLEYRQDGQVASWIDVRVEPDGDGTRVVTTAYNDRQRPRHVLNGLVRSPLERRFMERMGYRVTENSLDVQFSLT